jgi:hypothetical protein
MCERQTGMHGKRWLDQEGECENGHGHHHRQRGDELQHRYLPPLEQVGFYDLE